MNPLRFPPADRFARLGALLRGHNYSAEAVCTRTGIPTIYAFRTRSHGREKGTEMEDGLDVLIRLFLDVEDVAPELIRRHLGEEVPALLEEFGLLRAGDGGGDTAAATVLLYPTAGPWVASDLLLAPDVDPTRDTFSGDAVYPAVTRSAMVFLSALPTRPARRFLELCSGTGIAALLAAGEFAEEAWAVDITERSTMFARFNAALNGLDNVTALQGDLWEPVAGQTFDVIAAHPPYMAARTTTFVYRDGGEDGEQITRRILEGASTHLAPGGLLHCTCMLTDRTGDPVAARVRRMLGPDSDDLDVIVLETSRVNPWVHLSSRLLRSNLDQERETVEQMRAFGEMKVDALLFATVVVRKMDGSRPPVTHLRSTGPGTRWPQVAWMLDLAELLGSAESDERIASSRPRLSSNARLHVRYRSDPGGEDPWVAEAGHVQVTHPFVQGGDASLSVARFLGRCDGVATVREQLQTMRAAGDVPDDLPEDQFVGMVRGLVELAALELEELPVPPPPPERPGALILE